MEQQEAHKQFDENHTGEQSNTTMGSARITPAQGEAGGGVNIVSPQAGASAPCPACNTAQGAGAEAALPQFIYAMGRVEARFPTASVEKEFAQAIGRAVTEGLTDNQTFRDVLSKRENRYLLRQLCWVFRIEGIETYILVPRDPSDFDLLLESLRATPNPTDIDIAIGFKGPIAPATVCNGLMVPIVVFDQIYSFDRGLLIKSIPKPEKASEKAFRAAAEQLLDRILQLADNAGATDEHRALNYLVVRYPAIYTTAADAFARDASLTGVEVRPSPLSGTRKIVEVIFSFTNRNTDVIEKFFARVDVTEEFPFLVTKISPYYDR
jgi:hypothetical protein